MALTKSDVKEIVEENINVLMAWLIPILSKFATKDDLKRIETSLESTKEDVNELKDDIARLSLKVDNTVVLTKHQVDLNTKDIEVIKKHINLH